MLIRYYHIYVRVYSTVAVVYSCFWSCDHRFYLYKLNLGLVIFGAFFRGWTGFAKETPSPLGTDICLFGTHVVISRIRTGHISDSEMNVSQCGRHISTPPALAVAVIPPSLMTGAICRAVPNAADGETRCCQWAKTPVFSLLSGTPPSPHSDIIFNQQFGILWHNSTFSSFYSKYGLLYCYFLLFPLHFCCICHSDTIQCRNSVCIFFTTL